MNVLGKIERHLRKTGKKPTRFGREAANDCDPEIIKIYRVAGIRRHVVG